MTEVRQELFELPNGWVKTKIGDICNLINGRAFKPSEWSSEGVPIIRIQNLNDAEAEFNYCNFRIEEKYMVDNGQLLFAWSGTPETSFGAHIWNRGRAFLNQHIFKVEINEEYIDKVFLKHLLNLNVKEYISKAHGTAGLAHITKSKFEDSQMPLPPFNEQRKIATRVEELFSVLDAGVESLRKVKAQLKRYRQAVLKYAFEGKLTEEWRKTHKDQIEPAQKLLERVRREEAKKTKRPIELGLFDIKNLPELPEGWTYGRLENLIYIAGRIGWRGLKAEEYTQEGPLFLSVYNLNKGDVVDLSESYHLSEERYNESPEIQLRNDDILLVKDGAGIGKVGIVQGLTVKATVNSSLLVVRSGEVFKSKFLYYFLKGPRMQEVVKNRITGSATPHLFQRDIKKFDLLIPPILEQQRVIEEIESRFSVADKIGDVVDMSVKQAERLRQTILKNAFEGKLVPQDLSDESAEELLKRIRTEKAQHKTERNIKNESRTESAPKQTELIRYVK